MGLVEKKYKQISLFMRNNQALLLFFKDGEPNHDLIIEV
jgi:hypothetical protein